MLLRLCQLKCWPLFMLMLITLSACSWRQENNEFLGKELITTVSNKWFSENKNHTLIGPDGQPLPHLLFDTAPDFEDVDRSVDVLVAVPEDSEHSYSIDLYSGQRYYTHTYCKQKDIWSSYPSSVNRPVFSVGYIPRVLDQLGEIQKVIIWTKRKDFKETANFNYHKVKLVGAYVEQICPEGNCLGKSTWLSKLVFIGVDAEDKTLEGIHTIADFTKTFDWDASKATLENMDGRNYIGDKTYPAIKVGQLIEYEDAFDYFKKRSIFLTETELKKIQKGCHALYDGLWDEVGKSHPEDVSTTTREEWAAKEKIREELKKKKMPFGFAARFQKFTKKYFNEISTCEKFVYHGNLNGDSEKFWFLSYMGLYYRLHREGYYFDCKSKAWQRNIVNDRGQPVYDLKRDIDSCKETEIDQAMDYLPNFLAGIRNEKEFFRFVDYDDFPVGTSNKMYAWVKYKSRKFDCSNDENIIIKKQMKLFPEDVSWRERAVKDYSDDSKIIK
jgi:hypothetical protein